MVRDDGGDACFAGLASPPKYMAKTEAASTYAARTVCLSVFTPCVA